MLNPKLKKGITLPSVELPETTVHGSTVSPLVELEDFYDKSKHTLSNFYKGSPPEWADIAEDDNTQLIRRDVYHDIIKQINKCQKDNRAVSSINLFHHPGSGGSTLAMQVLWDMRKDFKCATIMHVSVEPVVTTEHIIKLFKDDRRTLLLLNDNVNEDDLMESLNQEIAKKEFYCTVPIAILLNAKRKHNIVDEGPTNLKNKLSNKELHDFELKEEEMKLKHSNEEMKQFHGFNLMKNNFSETYVVSLIAIQKVKKYVKEHETACGTELFSVLALLNSYVPGSFLPLSRCCFFLKPQLSVPQQDNLTTLLDTSDTEPGENTTEQPQFEKIMEPFMDLIVTFSRDEMKSGCVRLAHPMIANECLKALAELGITKGKIAKRFLMSCKPNEPPHMVRIIKSLLIKRETVEMNQEMFSRLILDIKGEGNESTCMELFEMATNTFEQDAFFPQAFARFLYLVFQDYDKAEHQAQKAIARDPENSFLRDTLGQIHKNHLRKLSYSKETVSDFLEVADLAIKAFKDEEEAAEKEQDPNTSFAQPKKIAHAFNCRGHFGYIQVAKCIFNTLTSHDQNWCDVLIGKKTVHSLREAQNILKYEDLIVSLQGNVEKKLAFFETYLTYSKPNRYKSEPPYFQSDVDECYNQYLLRHSESDDSPHCTMDRSFAGLFSYLDQSIPSSYLERLTEHARKIHEDMQPNLDATMNYILSNIILSNMNETSGELKTLTDLRDIIWGFVKKQSVYQSPEFFLLVLLLFWPDETQDQPSNCKLDLNDIVENMKRSFNQKYLKHFRSRYLRPLFFLAKGTGLKRLVHSQKIYNIHVEERTVHTHKRKTWASLDWGNGKIWEDVNIQTFLLRVNGVFRKEQMFAHAEDKEIAVYTDQSFVSCQGPASFFLGFTIKGPVAYDIKFEAQKDKFMKSIEGSASSDQCRQYPTCDTCAGFKDLTDWKQVHPEVLSEKELSKIQNMRQEFYWVNSPAGRYECSISGLRWVSDGAFRLKYHFADWEPYREDLNIMQFEPCGPLMGITVISGEIKEIHLPHFACLGSNPPLDDEVRVLGIRDDGMSLEMCELTRFHAKLLNPTFSFKGFLKKITFKVKAHCEVLIYKTLTAHLTLHVYLVTCDHKTIQKVAEQEKCALKISKPPPRKSLQLKRWYTLQMKSGNHPPFPKINPESLQLRRSPIKYFEVYIKDPQADFELNLMNDEKKEVWLVEIRAGEYGETSSSFDEIHQTTENAVRFVDEHRNALIQRVSLVTPIADDLKALIGNQKYSIIIGCKTPEEQMRKLYCFLSGGNKIKKNFYKSLLKNELFLVEELETSVN